MRVLAIDHEGGRGGSSKSLRLLLQHMRHEEISVDVWSGRKNEFLINKYKENNIECEFKEGIKTLAFVNRPFVNLYMIVLYVFSMCYSGVNFCRELRAKSKKYDLIHLNNENLFFYAFFLKKTVAPKIVMHIRTVRANNVFTRFQSFIINKYTDGLIFITDSEKQLFSERQLKKNVVIHNPIELHRFVESKIEANAPLSILSLANHEFDRGVDRIIEIAGMLSNDRSKNYRFVIAGDAGRGQRVASGGVMKLSEYAKKINASPIVDFIGHIQNVSDLLERNTILLKLPRFSAPWGRDILEAMAAGVVVVTLGNQNNFIKDGETGFITKCYRPETILNILNEVYDNRELLVDIRRNAYNLVKECCDPTEQSRKLLGFWQTVLEQDGR